MKLIYYTNFPLILLFLSTIVLYSGTADSKTSELNNEQSRNKFIQAERLIERKNYTQAETAIQSLKQYSLYPYLQYRLLSKTLSKNSAEKISDFLANYYQTPYADKLRNKWLFYLAKKQLWSKYLDFYPYSSITEVDLSSKKNTELACYFLRSLIKQGKSSKALPQIEPIWLSNRSQPDACDPVFSLWEKKRSIPRKLRWERIKLVMDKGRLSLARFLSKPLSKADKKTLNTWIDLYRRPDKLQQTTIPSGSSELQQIIFNSVFKRLARKKPDLAVKLISDTKVIKKLSDKTRYQSYKHIAVSLAREHRTEALQWFAKIPHQLTDQYSREWHVRAAIRNNDAQSILAAINQLDNEQKSESRWQYWQAKALQLSGKAPQAEKIYQQLANQRGYYSFLAADQLQQPYNYENSPAIIDSEKLKDLKKHPSIQRAHEFYQMGRMLNARREWYYANKNLFDNKQKVLSAYIAMSWGWHDRAIITIAKTDELNDLQLRFPLLYKKSVTNHSILKDLDISTIYAIIRRESAFGIDARSPVGAMGLMQLMPRTAKQVARQLKLKGHSKNKLFKADYNINLGTQYIKDMLKKYDNHIVLAAASYNAGPHRVKRWLPESKMDADIWLETIPFKETREYVSAILAYKAIYQYRLSEPVQRVSLSMPAIDANQLKLN